MNRDAEPTGDGHESLDIEQTHLRVDRETGGKQVFRSTESCRQIPSEPACHPVGKELKNDTLRAHLDG
jgi:hypothetical protein